MKFKIQNRKLTLNKRNNLILFQDNSLNIKGLENTPIKEKLSSLNKMIESNKDRIKDFYSFDLNPKLKIFIVKIDTKDKNFSKIEKIGAKFFQYAKSNSTYEFSLIDDNIKSFSNVDRNLFDKFVSGIFIRSYYFDIYKTKKQEKLFVLNIHGELKYYFNSKHNKFKALVDGINLTKDLVSEPGNVLHPDEYVKRILKLKSIGLKIKILNNEKLKKLGMNALLGVGQCSVRGSYLAIIEWNGANKKQKPLGFVGKGVCFDTGGISLKPAKFMEDMT